MVIYSDESDYEATWRKVDVMFDFRVNDVETTPPIPLWEREDVWGSCHTIQRNYRTRSVECQNSGNECKDSGNECKDFRNECCSETGQLCDGTAEFRVPIECQQDYDQLVASIVQDIENKKIQLGPLSKEFVVAPTKIVYPRVSSSGILFLCFISFCFFILSTQQSIRLRYLPTI